MLLKDEIFNFIKDKKCKFYYNTVEQEEDIIKRVLYSGPYWSESEIIAIIEAIISGKWMSAGEYVHRFEIEFSRMYNQTSALMLNSGSSANLILITAMKKYFDWNENDEIIVSPVGFPTTIAPIIQNNLTPKFVDIEFDSLNFDVDEIQKKLNSKTKAIFISPVLGNPPNLDKIIDLVDLYNSKHRIYNETYIKIILDSCDSLGSKWKEKYLNEYAFASTFSFYPAHHISTMEGGMITSNDENFIKLCRSFSWWGRDCYCVGSANLLPNGTCNKRFSKWLDTVDYDIDHKYVFNNIGYNLKPLDLQGAIGLEQLKKTNEIDSKRRFNKNTIEKIFKEELGDIIYIPKELENSNPSWFGIPIICSKYKKSLVEYLENNNIQTRNYFAGNILLHKGYNHIDDYKKYPNANRVLNEVFFIGCHPSYNEKTFNYIRTVIKNWRNSI